MDTVLQGYVVLEDIIPAHGDDYTSSSQPVHEDNPTITTQCPSYYVSVEAL